MGELGRKIQKVFLGEASFTARDRVSIENKQNKTTSLLYNLK